MRHLPFHQMDETQDNENDPHLCFRRREVRQTRKARKQDHATIDRMAHLQTALGQCLTLAGLVKDREVQKRAGFAAMRAQIDARLDFAELKRKFPVLELQDGDKELLLDPELERPRKKARATPPEAPQTIAPTKVSSRPSRAVPSVALQTNRDRSVSTPPTPDAIVPQKRKAPEIANKHSDVMARVEQDLAKRRAADAGQWEDGIDVSSQIPHVAPPLARFKPVGGRGSALRLRVGRGGRLHVDRTLRRHAPVQDENSERWKFDADGPMTADVDDGSHRLLVDDFATRCVALCVSSSGVLTLIAGIWR